MTRLSILIPCLTDHKRLETTLLSVLSACGDRCVDGSVEIVCVDRTLYPDPYRLGGDVIELLRAERRTPLHRLIQIGLQQAKGEIVHFIGCGLKATPNWYQAADSWFDDRKIGAVAPICWLGDQTNPPESALVGVRWQPWGRRDEVQLPGDAIQRESHGSGCIGPAWYGAFYRRSALESTHCFDGRYGDELSDVDAARKLANAGYTCLVEPRTQLTSAARRENTDEPFFARGRCLQRYSTEQASHSRAPWRFGILREILGGLRAPLRLLSALGRVVESRAPDSQESRGVSGASDPSADLPPTQNDVGDDVIDLEEARFDRHASATCFDRESTNEFRGKVSRAA